ncbi:efflux transporter outer membrane subunit [Robbsia andropogonis]|uniref:efflux transporter outer membrane subunit n=1 Tax=Robbsia andropogonis TaxID=28092 RepID=UPI0004B0064F|nr:efflux transporter outer membrane subunit [Robbsia andropogonis]MCP1119140.1 efflux transporter outer membrane subunit [Robbsia andropogonis]MCP1129009.1 efflux transporter outer membrane subunit [Robbsia andropogonis]
MSGRGNEKKAGVVVSSAQCVAPRLRATAPSRGGRAIGVGCRLSAIAGLVASSACTLGPDYRRPDVAVPAQWRSMGAADVRSGLDDGQRALRQAVDDEHVMHAWSLAPWWQRLNDPVLDDLVGAALARNRDLAIALEKVREARAAYGQASAQPWPSLSATASGTRQDQPSMVMAFAGPGAGSGAGSGGQSSLSGGPISFLQAGLSASWEVDLFGGNRRAAEAARYGLDAAHWQHRATMLALVGDVVRYYTQARLAQQQHAIERDNARTLTHLLKLTRARCEAGTASRLESLRFDADLRTTQARIIARAVQYRQAEHALSMLTGEAPGTWLPALQGPDDLADVSSHASMSTQTAAHAGVLPPPPLPLPSFPIAVAVPSSVLLMRPDLQVAERQYAAATARVGVAQAERMPKVSLVGSLYSIGLRPGDLARRSSIGWGIGPQISLPLFTGGRLRAAVDMAMSVRQQAFLTYESAVLTALRDVEDAVVGLSGAIAEADAAEAAEGRYAEAARLATSRFEAGADLQDATLIAKRDHAASRTRLADSRVAVTLAYIGLQKALGGGWDGRAEAADAPDAEAPAA